MQIKLSSSIIQFAKVLVGEMKKPTKPTNKNRKAKMKLADTTMESGFSFQEELLLQALERQALTGRLMTNPRVTGFTSFAKSVLNFINDKKAPKTCKNLYRYLLDKGYYDKIETRLNTYRKENNE